MPVKAFRDAKLRLAGVLTTEERRRLARELAARVIGAAGPLPVSVVCDDHEVAGFAESLGARVIWTPGLGLSGAVGAGVARLGSEGADVVVVAHADLPRARNFERLAPAREHDRDQAVVRIAPDRVFQGTNVIAVPTAAGFGFSYGRGSFHRHLEEARRLSLATEVVEDPDLSADVDLPADLALLRR